MSFLGLTVYGPEVARSGLTHRLDAFIHGQTGLSVSERFFVLHSRASIEAFYALTGSTGGPHWPLVLELFDMRPACATLWSGPNALSLLRNLKGNTQPAKASEETIRGRYCCDNPVTNLVHVSDDNEAMAAEMDILRSRSVGSDATGWLALDSGRISHSSFCVLLNLLGTRKPIVRPNRETDTLALHHARRSVGLARALAAGTDAGTPVERYLTGDPGGLGDLLKLSGSLSSWDRLLLEAGLFAMPFWHARLQPDLGLRSGTGS
ncbi:nucleoside-diphosphate kinase (plasmid) [Roseibium aggregatum]|uniref:nucleoside-diphosphate kinase n=1 Tax=Roseibium aggregatum TaxID=187304 RepID=UPI001E289358|nr:nucleoside-diphosphate kinase [Roseibium aggregatum]UES60118.1 nucleoside-diphosphate kinase [Roseibium aggregatum]